MPCEKQNMYSFFIRLIFSKLFLNIDKYLSDVKISV